MERNPVEQLTRNCYRSFARIPGATLIDEDGLYGVMSHVAIPFFSGIATTDIDAADVPRVIERFRAQRCPFRWWISPWTRPTNLEELLIANGLVHAYDAPGMVADLTTLDLDASTNVEIRRLHTLDEMRDWSDVVVRTFSRPEAEGEIWRNAFAQIGISDDSMWQHFVAYRDGEAVATTSLLVDGALAGIYHVATLPHARGRGIGAAVTREAMRFARDRGATHAALQSSELGYGVYRALGFVEQCQLRLYQER